MYLETLLADSICLNVCLNNDFCGIFMIIILLLFFSNLVLLAVLCIRCYLVILYQFVMGLSDLFEKEPKKLLESQHICCRYRKKYLCSSSEHCADYCYIVKSTTFINI